MGELNKQLKEHGLGLSSYWGSIIYQGAIFVGAESGFSNLHLNPLLALFPSLLVASSARGSLLSFAIGKNRLVSNHHILKEEYPRGIPLQAAIQDISSSLGSGILTGFLVHQGLESVSFPFFNHTVNESVRESLTILTGAIPVLASLRFQSIIRRGK